MKFHDLSFSRAPRTQLAVRRLDNGGLEVTTWNMVAEYGAGEFAFDPVREELELTNSRGETWRLRYPN